MIVQLRNPNPSYTDLAPHQYYVVIGIEADDLRILNDQGRPYLYPSQLFKVVDIRQPNDWIIELGDEGEQYAYPPALNELGFFEDFFDSKKEVVATFWRVINQRFATALAAA